MDSKAFIFLILILLKCYIYKTLAIDPGTVVWAFGTNVNTSELLNRINSSLVDYDRAYGRTIYLSINDTCLDASSPTSHWFTPTAQKCNVNSAKQQWRLVGDFIEVSSSEHDLGSVLNATPCLNCDYAAPDCVFSVWVCRGSCLNGGRGSCVDHQKFFFRIHARQIDLIRNRIYFSIYNILHPSSCLTLYYNSERARQEFHLAECQGYDNQSFYLDIDFTEEINRIKLEVIQTLQVFNKNQTYSNHPN